MCVRLFGGKKDVSYSYIYGRVIQGEAVYVCIGMNCAMQSRGVVCVIKIRVHFFILFLQNVAILGIHMVNLSVESDLKRLKLTTRCSML